MKKTVDQYYVPWIKPLKMYVSNHIELAWKKPSLHRMMSNENPIPPSSKVLKTIAKYSKIANRYPDQGLIIRGKIAKMNGLEGPENVVLGNGSSEVFDMIYRAFLRPGDEVIQQSPCFGIYKLRCELFGGKIISVPMEYKDKKMIYDPEGIIKAVASWRGLKRRLEKRLDGKVNIFDDIAHSPAKAQAVLRSLSSIYKNPPPFFKGRAGVGLRSRALKIIAVFEPNTGNRKEESIPGYANAFKNADEIIIPRLTQIKIAKDDLSPPFDGQKLAEVISQTHNNVKYIDEDEKLVQYIVDNANDGDVIIFLGSHGFRGMIDEAVSRVSNKQSKQ